MAPSDSNGVYSLPDGYLAVTGETVLASQHNPPLEDLGESMTNRLMRSGAAPMTGPLKLDDGAVGAPGLTFNSATTSGLYKTASGIGVAISGTKVAEFGTGGLISGSRYIGELIDTSTITAFPLTVLVCGQTLSRATYADLWGVAQTEIAAGNTFYNNGNGSTTFGIGDSRGRVYAGKDNMGGVAASRLTTAGGGVDGATAGAVGGTQNGTILQANFPSVNFVVAAGQTVSVSGSLSRGAGTDGGGTTGLGLSGNSTETLTMTSTGTVTSTGTAASGGSGTAFKITQPTMVVTKLLFAGA